MEKLLELDFSIPIEAKENELLYFETTGSFNSSLLELIAGYRKQQARAVSEYNMKIRHIINTYGLTQNTVAQYIREVSLGNSDSTRIGAKYMSLIAPYIHEDTELLIKVATIVSMIETGSLIFAKPFCTNDFVTAMDSGRCIADMEEDTRKFILETKDFLTRFES